MSDTHKNTTRIRTSSESSVKEVLLIWVQERVNTYPEVHVTNFSTCWNDGLAFCALIHHYYPSSFDFNSLDSKNRRYNFTLGFEMAEKLASIFPLLEVEDMVKFTQPDWKCVFTYVQSYHRRFRNVPLGQTLDSKEGLSRRHSEPYTNQTTSLLKKSIKPSVTSAVAPKTPRNRADSLKPRSSPSFCSSIKEDENEVPYDAKALNADRCQKLRFKHLIDEHGELKKSSTNVTRTQSLSISSKTSDKTTDPSAQENELNDFLSRRQSVDIVDTLKKQQEKLGMLQSKRTQDRKSMSDWFLNK